MCGICAAGASKINDKFHTCDDCITGSELITVLLCIVQHILFVPGSLPVLGVSRVELRGHHGAGWGHSVWTQGK